MLKKILADIKEVIKIVTSRTGAIAGSIRFDGADLEFYDGTTWHLITAS